MALGDLKQKLYRGPSVKDVAQGFIPTPIDTSKVPGTYKHTYV